MCGSFLHRTKRIPHRRIRKKEKTDEIDIAMMNRLKANEVCAQMNRVRCPTMELCARWLEDHGIGVVWRAQ